MNQQPQIQKPKNKVSKGFIVAIILILVAIFGWAGLTKAGFIPNYFNIEFLCAEQDKPNMPYFPPNGSGCKDCFGKPVIYLYPTEKQTTKIDINFNGTLLVSYPKYNKGWNVVANPDGKIYNLSDKKEYSYLFWEGISNNKMEYNLSSGFIVKGSETPEFLQSKLVQLGLTPKEYNEFIVYWMPRMINNNFNLIHFATKEEYGDKVELKINPKPDSVLRIFMVYKPLETTIDITPQEIKPFTRSGFVVVEWGGTEIK